VLSILPVFRINSATGRNSSSQPIGGEVHRKAPENSNPTFLATKIFVSLQIFKNIPATDVRGAGIAQSV
jgi:hypothetical protein